jgi:hypothetical protein
MLMNKKGYYEKLSGTKVYCSYNNTINSFEVDNENKLEDVSDNIKETLLDSLNSIKEKYIYRNKNKKLTFIINKEEIFYIGMFYNKNNKYHVYDISFNHIQEIASLSKKIKINKKRKIKTHYKKVYDDFIKHIEKKEISIETFKGKKTLKIKDLLSDKKVNIYKKIVYKNKKKYYNSIELYTMIVENSELILDYKLNLIKYDIISIYICKELCNYLNNLNSEVYDYSIYDIENKINYKIVKNFNSVYNKIKEIELLPPLLPIRM